VRLTVWLIGVVALGQTRPECDSAAARLHSDSPLEKAWGAHLAATCRLTGLAANVADQLVDANPEQLARLTWDSERFWMAHAFLDALIELRPSLGEPALNSILKGFPDDAAILMLQHPYAHQESLASLRTRISGGAIWVAASNALASIRSRGFAAALLRETAIVHRFVVSDAGETCCNGTAGSLMGGPLTLKVPSGFPPTHFYRLTAKPAPGDDMVADGPTPIYARRVLLKPGVEGTMPGQPEGFDHQRLRIEYLSRLAGLPGVEAEVAIEPNTAVRWSANLSADIARELEHQVSMMNRLAAWLRKSGALEASELPMTLKIDVTMENRTDKSLPLPDVPPHSFALLP
jgi:hypothetical protein